jgi:hypothetical protein
MSPDGFSGKKLFCVFELPLLRNAQKTPLKIKSIKNKNKNKNKIK